MQQNVCFLSILYIIDSSYHFFINLRNKVDFNQKVDFGEVPRPW